MGQESRCSGRVARCSCCARLSLPMLICILYPQKKKARRGTGPFRGSVFVLSLLIEGKREIKHQVADRYAHREFACIRIAFKPHHTGRFLPRLQSRRLERESYETASVTRF